MERRTYPEASGSKPFHMDQDVECGSSVRQMSFESVLVPMAHRFGVPHSWHHGEDRFHDHALVPLAPTADLDIGRIALDTFSRCLILNLVAIAI